MQVDVLIEPLPTSGFRASCSHPWPESIQAPTREGAIRAIQKSLESHMTKGSEIVRLNLTNGSVDPIWPDDELTRDWLAGIELARQEADRELAPGS